MKNEYQIEKDGQITTVNSKEEYEAFKKKYNSYDFVVMERTNKVKMISKNDKHPKTPKGMPE
jgi:mannose-1-phosphate guanylyltransferase